ncbi:MAG: hypothetical protein ABJ322_07180 [Marinobacter sp.]|uniref:hypothetical protein n=1 Tax=Marinobacter sp. TaxID=50741 RepID=UPI0032996E89
MQARAQDILAEFSAAEDLPADYPALAERWFVPLADYLLSCHQARAAPLLVGLHGAQGTGKTTLCRVLELLLADCDVRVLTLSLDDFYLGRKARQQLALQVHPLLATRGVPGTHEIALLQKTIRALRAGESCRVPRFDKSQDDRLPEGQWVETGPADIVLLEGWCVGAVAESESALAQPVNELEAKEDAEGDWRRYVNERLGAEYAELFSGLDYLVMLQAPCLEAVLQWRTLQEHKLARNEQGQGLMDDAAVERFVQHYQRITRHSLATLPELADYLLLLGEDHRVRSARHR